MKEENDEKLSKFNESDENDNHGREEVYSKVVRAGNRTYFFDVKATRKSDLYLTITESKKRFNKDGKFFFEKHKIFLYKEDFEKFRDGFEEVVTYVGNNLPDVEFEPREEKVKAESDTVASDEFINVEFEDLGEK
jgi:hypothetical protein